ncbi:hypothetical protein HIM_09126 [Hirsutella minnesotensis 3608]|uniref:FAD-binding domain-containing protein n=1 Tax=Hirsutella minnesotensis 3608 TaxID=1043627 RepID=A0A0F7ZXX6_9HYPO|nr:hypothetical protein HIM_09126 [Hirsutella minnesotensis 3608]
MGSSQPQIRLAIIGGGLAGTALANGLMRIPHIETHIYEVSESFSERGAALGLAPIHQQALGQLVEPIDETFARAGAVSIASMRSLVGSGENAGKTIFDSGDDGDKILHRASLLRELVAPLPKEMLHNSKKLTAIKQAPGEIAFDLVPGKRAVQLTFEDGLVEGVDAVIGADGLFSFVRNYVLEEDAATCAASPAGFWDTRFLVPIESARSALGDEFFEEPRQYIWCGDGAIILHDVIENGTLAHFAFAAVEKESPKDRKRFLTQDFLDAAYKGWSPHAASIIKASCLQGYSQMEHKQTPTYARGRVCLMGDAAHTTSPWQGAGAGLAFEDGAVLVALLGSVYSPDEISTAFQVFDAIRRPRCQRVIDSSRAVGGMMCGQDAEIGLDPDKLRKTLPGQWGFIMSLNIEEHQMDAVRRYRETLGKHRGEQERTGAD